MNGPGEAVRVDGERGEDQADAHEEVWSCGRGRKTPGVADEEAMEPEWAIGA